MSKQSSLDSVTQVLREHASHVDAEGAWPEQSIKAIAEAGLLAFTVPKELGGAGASMREFVEVTQKLAKACASTAMIYLMHICATQVIAASPERNALKRIASGQALATLAFSEKGSRSHFWAPVSHSRKSGNSIELDADKSFVTSAERADYYVVSSGAIDGKTTMESTLYLVDRDSSGVSTSGTWTGLGLRGNRSAPMKFKCHVSEAARLTPEGAGFQAMMQIVLPWFQMGSAGVSTGIADEAIACAVQHASSTRLEHLDQTLAESVPGIRARLARMRLTTDSAQAYVDQALGKVEKQAPDAMLAVLGVKAVAAEASIDVTDEAMRVCGGAAFGRQLSVERNFRDARASSIMAPTTDVLYDFIGKALAGLPLF